LPEILQYKVPEILQYKRPKPLLETLGSSWNFQSSEKLKGVLREALITHYENFMLGKTDKGSIPVYMILSGAGTGKSRTATELQGLAIECTDDQPELCNRLKEALVFNLSFENGTAFDVALEKDTQEAIGKRMLFQLIDDINSWQTFIKNCPNVIPDQIFDKIAASYGKSTKDLTIFLTIDGMQTTMADENDGKNKASMFYSMLTQLSIIARSGLFVICTCTATIHAPFDQFLAASHQLRIFLPTCSLDPPTRLNNGQCLSVFLKHPVIDMLVEDMGGHGRALESLEMALQDKDLDRCNFVDILHKIRIQLENNYSLWLSKDYADDLIPLIRVILTGEVVSLNGNLPGTNTKVESYTSLGLIRFEGSGGFGGYGRLTCPYVWLWIVAHNTNDPLLREWNFYDVKEVQHKNDPTDYPAGAQFWQHFEEFVAIVRALKSKVYNQSDVVSLETIHRGANHSFDDLKILNRHLRIARAIHQEQTASTSVRLVQCDKEQVNVANCEHCIINGYSASAGDIFLGIEYANTKTGTNTKALEVHQCKLVKNNVSQKLYEAEREKSMNSNRKDVFILYTCGKANVSPPSGCAIVSQENWNSYFGPFAGRAFKYAVTGPVNVNTGTMFQLSATEGIGKTRAGMIIDARRKRRRPYTEKDKEAFMKDTKIPRTVVHRLSFESVDNTAFMSANPGIVTEI
ncbi:229_t:CDS:1, partial [Paraglomus occultum]